jgi:hypothetical protein
MAAATLMASTGGRVPEQDGGDGVRDRPRPDRRERQVKPLELHDTRGAVALGAPGVDTAGAG